MAEGRIEISVESEALTSALGRMAARALSLRQPMQEIGASLVASTQQRFEDKKSPEGDPWVGASPVYALRKTKRGRKAASDLLRAEGYLLDTLNYLASDTNVAVGTNRTYSAIHQLGGTLGMAPGPAAIPARPHLGISRADEAEIAATLVQHLDD